jgi:hypothetical protein
VWSTSDRPAVPLKSGARSSTSTPIWSIQMSELWPNTM